MTPSPLPANPFDIVYSENLKPTNKSRHLILMEQIFSNNNSQWPSSPLAIYSRTACMVYVHTSSSCIKLAKYQV